MHTLLIHKPGSIVGVRFEILDESFKIFEARILGAPCILEHVASVCDKTANLNVVESSTE